MRDSVAAYIIDRSHGLWCSHGLVGMVFGDARFLVKLYLVEYV